MSILIFSIILKPFNGFNESGYKRGTKVSVKSLRDFVATSCLAFFFSNVIQSRYTLFLHFFSFLQCLCVNVKVKTQQRSNLPAQQLVSMVMWWAPLIQMLSSYL